MSSEFIVRTAPEASGEAEGSESFLEEGEPQNPSGEDQAPIGAIEAARAAMEREKFLSALSNIAAKAMGREPEEIRQDAQERWDEAIRGSQVFADKAAALHEVDKPLTVLTMALLFGIPYDNATEADTPHWVLPSPIGEEFGRIQITPADLDRAAGQLEGGASLLQAAASGGQGSGPYRALEQLARRAKHAEFLRARRLAEQVLARLYEQTRATPGGASANFVEWATARFGLQWPWELQVQLARKPYTTALYRPFNGAYVALDRIPAESHAGLRRAARAKGPKGYSPRRPMAFKGAKTGQWPARANYRGQKAYTPRGPRVAPGGYYRRTQGGYSRRGYWK